MHLRFILACFGLLLAISTATSFVGYRYLTLVTQYNSRNFQHLSSVYNLNTMLNNAPVILDRDHIPRARTEIEEARAQAQWCLDVLNDFDKWLFHRIGAGRALELCEHDIRLGTNALDLLAEMEASFEDGGEGPSFAMGLRLRNFGQAMLEDSVNFHPYLSMVQSKVEGAVRTGTAVAAFGLACIFWLLGQKSTSAQRVQNRQTRELSKLAAIAERANDSILVTNTEGRITWVNPAFEKLCGYTLDEIAGLRPGYFLQGEGTSAKTRRDIRAALAAREPIRTNILNYTKTGEEYWVNLSIAPLTSDEGEFSGFIAIASDITRERQHSLALEQANDQVAHQANHDALTGLPNRRCMDEVIAHDVRDRDAPRTLIQIDLDHFKYVNDTLGHSAGDFVLCQVAEIIQAHIRKSDMAARVGGDEFIILLSPDSTPEDAVTLTDRLRRAIRQDMVFEGQTCRIGASFGIATASDGMIKNTDLTKSADAALYVAKAAGRNKTTFYSPEIHQSVLENRRLSVEIERGLDRGEFEAYFQPQFDAKTEVLVGVEALARWRHPSLGVLPPASFLSVAERLKLVYEIDRQVFNFGLDRAASLNAEGLIIPKIAFNAGLAQLMNPDLPAIAARRDIGGTRISLEILESVLIEDQSNGFLERVAALREAGFGIELDDFGSGHASVIGLQKLAPETMKLDRELVAPIHQDRTARKLVASMVDIGAALGIGVLAEGVETAAHAAILRDLGCDALQGYYFAKPMPFDELRVFARSRYDDKLQKVSALVTHRDRKPEP